MIWLAWQLIYIQLIGFPIGFQCKKNYDTDENNQKNKRQHFHNSEKILRLLYNGIIGALEWEFLIGKLQLPLVQYVSIFFSTFLSPMLYVHYIQYYQSLTFSQCFASVSILTPWVSLTYISINLFGRNFNSNWCTQINK